MNLALCFWRGISQMVASRRIQMQILENAGFVFPRISGMARMVSKGSDIEMCFDNFGFPINSITVWILIFTDSRFATNTNADFGEWRIYFPADIGDGADGMVSFWNAIITVSQF